MKISETTILVLSNMAKLSQHLVIEAGNTIRIINEHGTSFIELDCEEDFPAQVALHDLSGFLKVINLFDDPDFEFKDKCVYISDELASQTYYYSEVDELVYNNDDPSEIDYSISFNLAFDKLDRVLKAATTNNVEDISIVGKDGLVYLEASDKENPTRSFSILVSEEDCGIFSAFLKQTKKSKINVLPIDYKIDICVDGAIRFSADVEDFGLRYIMALEADSEFE
jgi:hypothetical protein